MGSLECSGVLFDLDGVLVDSIPCVARVWRGWAVEHGFDPNEVIKLAHGRRAIETVQLLAPHLDSAAELRDLERLELDDTEGLVRIEGADRLLASIPPDRWAVVTSGTRRLAEKRMRVAGLPLPEKMVSADEVKLGKPDPAPFLGGAQLLGFGPEQCIAVEDAPSGILAAHRAGMRVLAVPTTYPRAELSEADVLLESLAQLRASAATKAGGGILIQLQW